MIRPRKKQQAPEGGMVAKKSLGQNFLMHQATAERIADAACLSPTDTVLEIGPGTGMLTRALLARAGRVIAIEADAALMPNLQEAFSTEIAAGKLALTHADIREFDSSSISGPYVLAANIPYYITGEIIRKFLTAAHKPAAMTLLVQKEVAERIARNKKESLLSLSVKAYGTPSYAFTVPRGAFLPAPNVDSAVLRIADIRQDAFPTPESEKRFFTILRAGFAHKRKQLGKNLEEVAPKEKVLAALTRTGVAGTSRSEDLSLGQWRSLAAELGPFI